MGLFQTSTRSTICRQYSSLDSLDATLVQPENPRVPALLFKVGLQVVPRPQEFAAITAGDPGIGLGISRYSQPDGQAVRTFKVVVEV
jgi:hypothetical protein